MEDGKDERGEARGAVERAEYQHEPRELRLAGERRVASRAMRAWCGRRGRVGRVGKQEGDLRPGGNDATLHSLQVAIPSVSTLAQCLPSRLAACSSNASNWCQVDATAITTTAPGLYEVTFGFFTRKKPTVQLLVNGEPVVSAVNSASYAVHHSSGRLAAIGPHPAGNVTGLTLIDFLALPPKARVTVTYQGACNGHLPRCV
jgi:hypothetical protein